MIIWPTTRTRLVVTGALTAIIIVGGLAGACSAPHPGSSNSGQSTSTSAGVHANSSTPTATTPPAGTQTPATGEQTCGQPSLRIAAPLDGSSVRAPFQVTYHVRCFPIGQHGTIQVSVDGIRLDLHPQTSTDTITVPDHPLLSGRRTLIFQLARPDNGPLTNPDAQVIIHLTIEGSR
jgi:hypothetical protein